MSEVTDCHKGRTYYQHQGCYETSYDAQNFLTQNYPAPNANGAQAEKPRPQSSRFQRESASVKSFSAIEPDMYRKVRVKAISEILDTSLK